MLLVEYMLKFIKSLFTSKSKKNSELLNKFKDKLKGNSIYWNRVLRIYFVDDKWMAFWNWILATKKDWTLKREDLTGLQKWYLKSLLIYVENNWEFERKETIKL